MKVSLPLSIVNTCSCLPIIYFCPSNRMQNFRNRKPFCLISLFLSFYSLRFCLCNQFETGEFWINSSLKVRASTILWMQYLHGHSILNSQDYSTVFKKMRKSWQNKITLATPTATVSHKICVWNWGSLRSVENNASSKLWALWSIRETHGKYMGLYLCFRCDNWWDEFRRKLTLSLWCKGAP